MIGLMEADYESWYEHHHSEEMAPEEVHKDELKVVSEDEMEEFDMKKWEEYLRVKWRSEKNMHLLKTNKKIRRNWALFGVFEYPEGKYQIDKRGGKNFSQSSRGSEVLPIGEEERDLLSNEEDVGMCLVQSNEDGKLRRCLPFFIPLRQECCRIECIDSPWRK